MANFGLDYLGHFYDVINVFIFSFFLLTSLTQETMTISNMILLKCKIIQTFDIALWILIKVLKMVWVGCCSSVFIRVFFISGVLSLDWWLGLIVGVHQDGLDFVYSRAKNVVNTIPPTNFPASTPTLVPLAPDTTSLWHDMAWRFGVRPSGPEPPPTSRTTPGCGVSTYTKRRVENYTPPVVWHES